MKLTATKAMPVIKKAVAEHKREKISRRCATMAAARRRIELPSMDTRIIVPCAVFVVAAPVYDLRANCGAGASHRCLL